MILELAKKLCERYSLRSDRIVYAHMLEKPVFEAVNTNNSFINGYMIIGEMIHEAAGMLLEPTTSLCEIVFVKPKKLVQEAKRFVMVLSSGISAVTLCGTPDGFYRSYPVEIKTTRNHELTTSPKVEWVLRAKIYATLARKPFAYLSIIDIVNAREVVYECRAFTWRTLRALVTSWLEGKNIVREYKQQIMNNIRRVKI